MNTIQVNYDMSKPGRDYERLFNYLKSFDGWAHVLDSLWFVRTTKTAAAIRDEIKTYVDANDKVMTVNVTNDEWATNFSNSSTNWLHGHMSSSAARRAA